MPTAISKAGDIQAPRRPQTMTEAMRSDKADWEFVTIPKEDAIGNPHCGVGLNQEHWGPGTHQVPPVIAEFINARLAILDRQTRRILLPRQDEKTVAQMGRNGNTLINPETA
jgi:hypothetical protein